MESRERATSRLFADVGGVEPTEARGGGPRRGGLDGGPVVLRRPRDGPVVPRHPCVCSVVRRDTPPTCNYAQAKFRGEAKPPRRFPGANGPRPFVPDAPPGGADKVCQSRGDNLSRTIAGRRWSRPSRLCEPHSGSAIQRKQGSSCSLLMAARDLGSRPPIAAEVGRDRLTSVGREPTPRTASGGQNASGGGHLIGVPLRRTARPLVDHYPRAKSEDDAVGAPRLVLRRWDTTVVPRRVPPAPMRSKCPKGRGRVPRPTSQLEVLVGRAGDESVRQ